MEHKMNANDPWVVDPKTLEFVNLNSTAIKELCLVVESILKKGEKRDDHPAFQAWLKHQPLLWSSMGKGRQQFIICSQRMRCGV
jgi:hypothetical protein